MPIEPRDFSTVETDTALGRALVDFFDVLEPVFSGGDKGVFQDLLRLPQVKVEEFERLANEAIGYYVGNSVPVMGNLKVVISDYHRNNGE